MTKEMKKLMTPKFAEKRIRCGKECQKGGKCQTCERIIELSENLKEANILVSMNKEE